MKRVCAHPRTGEPSGRLCDLLRGHGHADRLRAAATAPSSRSLRVRYRADPHACLCGRFPHQVLPDGDALPSSSTSRSSSSTLSPSTPWAPSGSWRCCSSCSPSSSPTPTCGARRPGMDRGALTHGTRRKLAQRLPADHRRAGRRVGCARRRSSPPPSASPAVPSRRRPPVPGATTWRASAWRLPRLPAPGRSDDRRRAGQPEDGPGAAAGLRPDAQPQVGDLHGVCASSGAGCSNNYASSRASTTSSPSTSTSPAGPPRPDTMDAILKLHQKIQDPKLAPTRGGRPGGGGTALKALPTIEMKGLLR
ncbi:hypothetical protein SVIOM74S_05851 [Streptomyces violarus]